jgi:pentatricopeptide repeat protein
MENNSLLPSLYSDLLQEMDKNPLAYIAKYKQSKGEMEHKRQWIELVLAQGYVFCYFPEKAIALCVANIDKLHNHPENILLPNFLMAKATAHSMLSQTELMLKTLETAEELLIKPFSLYPGLTIKMLWAIYYLYVQKPIPAEMYAMKVIESLDKVKDPQISAYLLWKLGSLYNRLRKYDLTFGYLVRAYDVCEQYNLKMLRLILSIDLISVNAHLKKFEQAEKLFKHAGKLSRELGIASYEIGINFNYGLLNKIRGNIPEAIKYYLISLEILSEAGLDIPSTEFNIYNNLANAYSQNKDFDLALECFKKVAEIAERIGNLDLQMQVSNNIGLNLVAQKRFDEALPLIKKAISHFKKMKNWELLTKAIRTEAFLYQETKQYRRGFLALEKLDQVRTKHVIQIQTDNALHANKMLETYLDENAKLRSKFEITQRQLEQKMPTKFVGSSKETKRILETVKIASTHPGTSVFINGESGTGKEIVARMIHENSSRREYSYVTVNCAAISPNLFESEFFGHVKGAFTGADYDKKGFFQLANKGTLFLDEISEMPIDFQAKLLRVLDSKTLIPVGKGTEISVDCRIISATNNDIQKMINEHSFRLDLFHRISALEIYIPPLRERMADMTELVDYFLEVFAKETNKGKPHITRDFLDRLRFYDYPGNVRELKNYIERIFILHYKPVWDASILDNIKGLKGDYGNLSFPMGTDLKSAERIILMNTLDRCGGKQSDAAKMLKMTESTFSRKLKRLGIK